MIDRSIEKPFILLFVWPSDVIQSKYGRGDGLDALYVSKGIICVLDVSFPLIYGLGKAYECWRKASWLVQRWLNNAGKKGLHAPSEHLIRWSQTVRTKQA